MNTDKIRRMIHALYEVMSQSGKEFFEFDINNENTPAITNQNNGVKYTVCLVYLPNVGREKYFIELEVYNPYDWQYYNVILDEDNWDDNVLNTIYRKIYHSLTNEKREVA